MNVNKEEFESVIWRLLSQETLLRSDGSPVLADRIANIRKELNNSICFVQLPCSFCNSSNVSMADRYQIGWAGHCLNCESYGTSEEDFDGALELWNISYQKKYCRLHYR